MGLWVGYGFMRAVFLLVYDPIDYVAKVESIFNALTVTGLAALVSSVGCFLPSLLPPVRRHLLRDREPDTAAVC